MSGIAQKILNLKSFLPIDSAEQQPEIRLAQVILAIPLERRDEAVEKARDTFLTMYEEQMKLANQESDIPDRDGTIATREARRKYSFTYDFTGYEETLPQLLDILKSLGRSDFWLQRSDLV